MNLQQTNPAVPRSIAPRASVPESRPRQPYLLACVLAVTALTYIGTLRFDFVSDDNLQIADNRLIKSWRNAPHFFVSSVWAHLLPQTTHNYYRPIYLLWNLLNYSLFKLNPMGWHATALLLHLGVTALVYFLIRRLVPGRPAAAWLAALIFGIHPIHHEVVAWVSGATESLYAIFFLGSFLTYCRSRERNRIGWLLASCVLYALAMFTKETAIVLPGLVFTYEWLAHRAAEPAQPISPLARLARATVAVLPYVPVVALYIVMRVHVLSAFGYSRVSVSIASLLFTWPSVLLFYLQHWLLPVGYSAYYDFPYYSGWQLAGVILPAVVLLVVAAGLWLVSKRLGTRETALAAIWMAIPLVPALDLSVFPLHELAHDRYFYVPSIGAALLIALLLEPIGKSGARLWGQPRSLVFVALLLTAALSFSAATAANQWVNDLTLLTRAHHTAPQNLSVRNDLSAEWIAEGRFDEAKAMLDPLVREAPQDWMAWLNLGRVDYQKQNFAAAERDLDRAIQLNPESGVAYILLGQTQLKTGRMPEALDSVRRGVDVLPEEYRFRVIYGIVLQASGDCPSAVSQFNVALQLHPNEGIAERGLALCHAPAKNPSVVQDSPISR